MRIFFFLNHPLEKMDDPTGSTASFIRKISSFRTFFCLIVSREGRSSRLLNRTTSQHPPTILRGIVSFRAIYWGRLLWDPVIYIFFLNPNCFYVLNGMRDRCGGYLLFTDTLSPINKFFVFLFLLLQGSYGSCTGCRMGSGAATKVNRATEERKATRAKGVVQKE